MFEEAKANPPICVNEFSDIEPVCAINEFAQKEVNTKTNSDRNFFMVFPFFTW
jgi:hypothetical protein